jgi:hypothetical protein
MGRPVAARRNDYVVRIDLHIRGIHTEMLTVYTQQSSLINGGLAGVIINHFLVPTAPSPPLSPLPLSAPM